VPSQTSTAAVVGVAQGGLDADAALLLFAQALEDQHVGIDRGADRQHDAGDAGQRERRVEGGHRRQDQKDVQQHRDRGN
jgi:hypothetical protein